MEIFGDMYLQTTVIHEFYDNMTRLSTTISCDHGRLWLPSFWSESSALSGASIFASKSMSPSTT